MEKWWIASLIFVVNFSLGQQSEGQARARLSEINTWCDVIHYELHVQVQTEAQYIKGYTVVTLKVEEGSDRRVELKTHFKFDLLDVYSVDSVVFEGKNREVLKYSKNAFYVDLDRELKVGEELKIKIAYQGKAPIAKNAPWDGGFVFSKGKAGEPFVGVACQEIGAYSWWPNKYLLSDKCDSADVYFEVPEHLQAISNGKLINVQKNGETTTYHWKISYPINNYNISVTIGKFTHFKDVYTSKNTSYSLDYYVLPENYKKAKKQFKQVKPMLAIYEKLFGVYPFAKDGFKLIEAPYLGMEHQSGIAYGNRYKNGYAGKFFASANKKFDFILIHEAGHEYWGNNVCMSDLSDMWIHEAFCTYTELLYVEARFGKKYTEEYVNYWKTMVQNQAPLVTERHEDILPPTDIYYKGALLLHTVREIVKDDKLFLDCLKKIQTQFALKTIDTETLTKFMTTYLNRDVSAIFQQYLYEVSPPILNFTLTPKEGKVGYVLRYKWDGTVPAFKMPITVEINRQKITLPVTTEWGEISINKEVKQYDMESKTTYYIVKYE